MARPKGSTGVPSYRLHKASDRGVVTIAGKDHYLPGAFDSAESRGEYHRLIAEWEAQGRSGLPQSTRGPDDGPTVAELCAGYWTWANGYYKNQNCFSHLQCTTRVLVEMYGGTRAAAFGSLKLLSVQKKMEEKLVGGTRAHLKLGWTRRFINACIGTIRRIFKWGVAREIVPASVLVSLSAITPLMPGRTTAREKPAVMPVSVEDIEATFQFLPSYVRDIVELIWRSGARPSEICNMRGVELDTRGPVWTYAPTDHKTAWTGRKRLVYFGPEAQEVLRRHLKRDLKALIFDPEEMKESHFKEKSARCAARAMLRRNPKYNWQHHYYMKLRGNRRYRINFRERIIPAVIAKRIRAAAAKADQWAKGGRVIGNGVRVIPHWHPYQLRHTTATMLAEQFGLETARAVLGHTSNDTTLIYAAPSKKNATDAMLKVG